MKSNLENSSMQNSAKTKNQELLSNLKIYAADLSSIKLKIRGVINNKMIRKIYRKIQANVSTNQSDLVGVQHDLLGMAIQPATYRTIIGQDL